MKVYIHSINDTLNLSHDKNYRDFFEILTNKVSCYENILIAEPLKRDNRESLLQELYKNPAIEDPGTAF